MSALRGYQHDAVNALFKYFQNNTGNPVVAMPTGTGKSHVISGFIQTAMHFWPNQRFMVLTHVKELITQNYNKLIEAWPTAPVGIYSAGLGVKELYMPITFGGIASVINVAAEIGHIDILFVDECHLLNPNSDTMYARLIIELKKINKYLKVVGFSATPWRMGQGHIVDGGVFTDLAIDMTGMAAFNWFVAEGYIVPLIPRPTQTKMDLTGVGMSGGDFNMVQVAAKNDIEQVTWAALQELVHYGHDRHRWLIFASSVDHAENITNMLNYMGYNVTCIHSRLSKGERDERMKDYYAGRYRGVVNYGVLTTGFDDPKIDLIGMFRPTLSPGLWVQMLGRGTRPYYFLGNYGKELLDTFEGRLWAIQASQKQNCLVLDFAGNVGRLGPINDPVIPRKKGEGGGDAPIKICTTDKLKVVNGVQVIGCGCYNHAAARHCDMCHNEFDFSIKFSQGSGVDELIATDEPVFEWFDIDHVFYMKGVGPTGVPYLRVDYWSRKKKFTDFVYLEHSGFVLHKSKAWWLARSSVLPPATIDEALQLAQYVLKKPLKINCWMNKAGSKFPEVMNYEYE